MKRKTKGGGDCYYIAGQFAMDNVFSPKKIDYKGTPYLVHAEVQGQGKVSNLRYGHAWIEDDENVYDFSNGRELIIPKVLYYAIGDIKTDNPKKYQKYTFSEARKRMLQYKHYGCWDLDVEYKEGGEVISSELLLAPNGNKSNLNEVQYRLVRTPEFKAWFGDWENSPETASKVVDYNGEPLPVYHGTNSEPFVVFYDGSFFTDDYMNADGYASGEMIYEVFLNIKKPLIINARGRKWDNLKNKYGNSTRDIASELDTDKYDGVIFNNINDNWFDDEMGDTQNVYFSINPKQIKLADGTNTTFDSNNADIRYSGGGETPYVSDDFQIGYDGAYEHLIAPNGKLSNLAPKQYHLVRTPEFKAWFGFWDLYGKSKNYYDYGVREIAIALKSEKEYAIKEAVEFLSSQVTKDDVLIPMPSRIGIATDTKKLAEEIAKKTGAKMFNCLVGIERDSIYELKKSNKNVTKFDFKFELNCEIPKARNYFIVDNVIGTGITMKNALQQVIKNLGAVNVNPLVYAIDVKNISKLVDDNGEPLICFHGSNNEFNVFEEKYLGSSNDMGFYGQGFYFTFQKDEKYMKFAIDEAGYYGKVIKPYFIKSLNPFIFGELKKYNGVSVNFSGTKSLVFLNNIAKKFPQLAEKITLNKTIYNSFNKENEVIQVPISILPDLIDKYSEDLKIIEVEDRGEIKINGYLKSKTKEVFYDYTESGGKKGSYLDFDTLSYGIDGNNKKESIEILLIEAALEKYDGIEVRYNPEGYMTRFPEITDAIKENHDCIMQGETGDELVVFKPTQIKLADGTNTTFDANNPDIRYAEGGQIEKYKDYEIKQKLSFVEEKLNQKKLTPSQILYLASLLNFGHHDIEFSGFSGKKINNFYQKRNELRQRIEEIAKPIRKGYVGYLDEEEAYHFTNMGSLFHIIEDGRINTANNNLSITTNFLLGEKGTSTVRNYRGMGSNAELFSDLPVKLVLDMNKLKKEAVFNTGKWSGGTHFGEYELIVSDFKKPFPYYIKRIEIDKNEMDESGILNYPLSIYKDYKYSSKSKPITISFKDQVKKLNIPIIERKRIDVKEYLFGENSKNIRYAQGGGLDNIEVKIIEDDSLAEKVYDIVQDDLSVAVPRLALIENGKVIGGIYLEPAHVLDGKREPLWEYKFDIYIKRSKRKKGYSKLLLDAMIKDFVDNFPDADQIRGEVINNRLEKSLIKNYGFHCDSGNQEEITYCYLSREDAIDYLKNKKFAFGGKLKEMIDLQRKGSIKEKVNFIKENPEVLVGKFLNGGKLDNVLSIEQVENKLGRELHWWNDDIVYLSGIEYKKVYLRPEYKKV